MPSEINHLDCPLYTSAPFTTRLRADMDVVRVLFILGVRVGVPEGSKSESEGDGGERNSDSGCGSRLRTYLARGDIV